MPQEIIKQRVAALTNNQDSKELKILLDALVDGIRVITAKLDADAGVTDTNYTTLFDAQIIK